MMKPLLLFTLLFAFQTQLSAQMIARMEVKEPIEGVCDTANIYALFSIIEGQVQASCFMTDEQMLQQLNERINYVKSHPKYKAKGTVSLIVNCEGDLVLVRVDDSIKSEELKKELEAFFKTFDEWSSGKLYEQSVDSVVIFGFKIKNGLFIQ